MAMRMGSSISPISAHSSTGGSGHEQQREDACEIGSHLFHIVQLYQLEVQRCQQQHQTVDAGRDRQRQHYMKDLAQKTKRKNARELKNIFRSKVPLSSIKSVNGHIKGKVYRRSPNPSTVILDKKICTFRRELCKKRRTGFPVRQKTIHYR